MQNMKIINEDFKETNQTFVSIANQVNHHYLAKLRGKVK